MQIFDLNCQTIFSGRFQFLLGLSSEYIIHKNKINTFKSDLETTLLLWHKTSISYRPTYLIFFINVSIYTPIVAQLLEYY